MNISASAIATMIGMRYTVMLAWRLQRVCSLFVMLVFSEIFPKTVAAMHAEKVGFVSSHIFDSIT